jgi:hypothetical protein
VSRPSEERPNVALDVAGSRARHGIRLAVCGLAFIAACAMPAAGHAASKEREAARAFDQAAELFAQGEYRRAALGFTRAFELVPHGDSAYNAALSWERANEPVRAAEAYTDALDRGLQGEARDDATSRLARLTQSLGFVKIKAPGAAVVRLGDRAKEAPATFFVEPGSHEIVVIDRSGHRQSREFNVDAGEEKTVRFGSKNREEPQPEADTLRADDGNVWQTVGWAGVATGAVLAGVALYVGFQSSDARDEFNSSDRTDVEKRDKALSLQTWTRVAWVSAGLIGGGGVVVLLVADGDSPAAPASALPHGIAIRGTF